MKKFSIYFLFFIGALQYNSCFASFKFVGPMLTLKGKIDNQTFFTFAFHRDLSFTSYDQDVSVYAPPQSDYKVFFVYLPEEKSGTFYLNYVNYPNTLYSINEAQCQFDISSDSLGNVHIKETPVSNAYVSCAFTGDSNNLILHLTLNANYTSQNKTGGKQ